MKKKAVSIGLGVLAVVGVFYTFLLVTAWF